MKRLFDLVVASAALLIATPLLLLLVLLIRARMGSPVLFCQVRPGLHAKPFEMVKLRTMLDLRSEDGVLLPDSQRQTRLGHFLRATSLDELPELWNVVKGDMSLVGPRPLLMEYLDTYDEYEWRRHDVRPGVTGWAQINGRNNLALKDRYALDVWYVENQSWRLDLEILWRTFVQVLRREGSRPEGYDQPEADTEHQSGKAREAR